MRDVETGLSKRIGSIEEALAALTREIAALREGLPDAPRAVPSSQERLEVDQPVPAAKARRREPEPEPEPSARSSSTEPSHALDTVRAWEYS